MGRRGFQGALHFGKRRDESVIDPNLSACIDEGAFPKKRPNLPNGGMHLPFLEDVMCSFPPPLSFAACKAVTLGDARDGIFSDLKKIMLAFHVNWAHAPARQIERVSEESEGDNLHLLRRVDEVLDRC